MREPRRALTMLMKFALERRPRRQRGRREGRAGIHVPPGISRFRLLVVTKARARHNLVRRGLWERNEAPRSATPGGGLKLSFGVKLSF
jgi:hypothetical protein